MRSLLIFLSCILATVCEAQYFQFSQYNFTEQRISPAYVASSNYASIGLVSRDQATEGNFHINSNFFNVAYPLINRKGRRWSGVGISFMDDRSGSAGIFNTQEVALSYAVNLSMSKLSSLALGFIPGRPW